VEVAGRERGGSGMKTGEDGNDDWSPSSLLFFACQIPERTCKKKTNLLKDQKDKNNYPLKKYFFFFLLNASLLLVSKTLLLRSMFHSRIWTKNIESFNFNIDN
jgi:hypothetical protein